MSEAFVATLFGIIIGPLGLHFIRHDPFGSKTDLFTLEISRFIIGFQCFAAGIDSPGKFIKTERKSLAVLLGPVLLAMWGVSTVIMKFTLQLDWTNAMIIAACTTPTDPVLANTIVKGLFADTHIAENLRNLLAGESAANDGLGLPLVLFPIILSRTSSLGTGISWWLLDGNVC